MIRDLRRLWQLWRARHENPLYWYLHPRRRLVDGLVYRLGWLPLLLALIGMLAFLPLHEAATYSTEIMQLLQFFIVAVVLLVPALPLYFMMISNRPWPRERCTDLVLSRMTPQEVAFGFAWWPLLGTSAMAVGMMLLFVELLWIVNNKPGERLLFSSFYFIGLSCVVVCTLNRIGVGGWRRWLAPLLVPMRAFFYLIPMYIMAIVLVEEFDNSPRAAILAGVLYAIAFLFWLKGRFGLMANGLGARLLGSAAAELRTREAWFAREQASLQFPHKGRAELLRMARAWAGCLKFELPALLAVGGAFWWWMRSFRQGGKLPLNVTVIIAGGVMLTALLVVLSLAIRRIHRKGRLPIQSGGIINTVALHALPPLFAVGIPTLALTFPRSASDIFPWLIGILFVGVIPLVPTALLTTALLLVRRWSTVFSLVIAAVMAGALLWMQIKGPSNSHDAYLLPIILGVSSLLFVEEALLRLFKAETYDVPLGRLSTDDNRDLPFMSDEVLDRLNAEAESR